MKQSMNEEICRLRAENERLTKERDDAYECLTIAYMQGAASVRARAALRSLANKEGVPTTFPKCRKEPVDVRDFIRKNKEGK